MRADDIRIDDVLMIRDYRLPEAVTGPIIAMPPVIPLGFPFRIVAISLPFAVVRLLCHPHKMIQIDTRNCHLVRPDENYSDYYNSIEKPDVPPPTGPSHPIASSVIITPETNDLDPD